MIYSSQLLTLILIEMNFFCSFLSTCINQKEIFDSSNARLHHTNKATTCVASIITYQLCDMIFDNTREFLSGKLSPVYKNRV